MKRLKNAFFYVLILCFCSVFIVFTSGCVSVNDKADDQGLEAPDYWPTPGWQSSSPERQGMNSNRLADLLEAMHSQNYPIRSLLVIRKGYLVVEAYFPPFRKEYRHQIKSCTKGITSALIGIAVDNREISDENRNVLDFFPGYSAANLDNWKRSMSLRHLLMMSSGMDTQDSYLYHGGGTTRMMESSDWVQYVLDLPMIEAPGTRFEYSNCVSYLIGAILQAATHRSGLEYGHQYLFSPLGISAENIDWPMSPQGIVQGFSGIRLRVEDLAKIGFLYLHKGKWDNRQVISENWINKSTTRQITANGLSEDYGYQWWVDRQGYFMALGYSGQYLIVHPGRNLVVVFFSALAETNFFIPETLYNQYILNAIQSDRPIPENPQGQARLNNIIHDIANPIPNSVPPLPPKAAAISGQMFYFESNELDFKSISVTFTPGADVAELRFSFRDRNLQLPVGLDNVYRVTWQFDHWRAYRGRWENDTTFILDYQLADHDERGTIRLIFGDNSDSVHIYFRDELTGDEWEFNAHS